MANEISNTFFCPSKINLFFRVLKKREDGYHEIASLYQAISLGDHLQVTLAKEDHLSCTDSHLACDHSNLVLKAAALFRREMRSDVFAHFFLTKKIPIQAGLGGGSSDAATALWALNELCMRPLSLEQLISLAKEIGSDVPFFFSKGTAYCTGRGEILKEVGCITNISLWIAKPMGGLSTPLVYKHMDPATLLPRDPLEILEECLRGTPNYFNDLEQAAFRLMPSLVFLKEQLLALGFNTVVMSGSGTSFFCLGEVSAPVLEGIQFYPAHFLFREDGSWYELPSFCYS